MVWCPHLSTHELQISGKWTHQLLNTKVRWEHLFDFGELLFIIRKDHTWHNSETNRVGILGFLHHQTCCRHKPWLQINAENAELAHSHKAHSGLTVPKIQLPVKWSPTWIQTKNRMSPGERYTCFKVSNTLLSADFSFISETLARPTQRRLVGSQKMGWSWVMSHDGLATCSSLHSRLTVPGFFKPL